MNTLASVRMIRRLSQTARPLTRHAITKACLPSRIISSSTPLANGETVYSRSMPYSTIQTMSFSTTDETMVDLSTMSTAQLQQLALKYVRQDNPIRAQLILERLELLKDDGIDLSNVRTSVIDSWVKYQNAGLKELKESISTHEDINLRVQKGRLAEICHAAECASQIVDDMENPSSHHIIAILKAWANACEAAHGAGLTKTDFLRGVPQRTQHIVTLHNSTNEPSVELYNQVIKAWTYSGEHLRGTMAEQIFVKLENPNGETFKLMLRAWCLSKEHRCAFTATGHFMRMMRRLETGQSDMEPSMDDYHILFQAWATAE